MMLSARVPEELKRRVDTDRRANQDVVETALIEHYGTRDKTAIEMRIENKRAELKAARETLSSEQENVEELVREIERLKKRKENELSREEKQERNVWLRALDNISPPPLSHIDEETWTPDPNDNAVQAYANELDMDPKEFADQYPEKRRQYADE